MAKLNLILALLISLSTQLAAQTNPTLFKKYIDNDDKFIVNVLTLSSDKIFFYNSSCECGKEYYAKGTWKIRGKKLFLTPFDSTEAYPISKIDLTKGKESQDVLISTSNYFNEPLKNLMLALILNDSTKFNPDYVFADSLGNFKVSKADYMGFYLIYEYYPLANHPTQFYYFDKTTEKIHIHIDFAEAGFDREPVLFNFFNQVYKIKNDSLYSKKDVLIYHPYKK